MTFDRSAIMKDAHSRFRRRRDGPFPLAFGECLSRAWQAARERREQRVAEVRAYHAAPIARRQSREFPQHFAA